MRVCHVSGLFPYKAGRAVPDVIFFGSARGKSPMSRGSQTAIRRKDIRFFRNEKGRFYLTPSREPHVFVSACAKHIKPI